MKRPLPWLPWRVDSWLYGSSRHELTRAQRSDFLDLALFSAKDEGWIRANETMPYPIAQLAGMFCIRPEELEETIERCIEVGKITRFPNGILRITNYADYRLTSRWRRKLEEGSSSRSSSKKINQNIKREYSGPKKRNCVPQKRNSRALPSGNQAEELDKDGLLPIPRWGSPKSKDQLAEFRAEIRDDLRDLAQGKRPGSITREGVEKKIAAFNQRVRDLT